MTLRPLLRLLYALADSEDVAIWVTNVHLSDTPRLVSRRPGDVEILFQAMLVDRIDVVDPDRHPDAVAIPVVEPMRSWKAVLVATALAVLAQEDLALAG